VKGTKRRAVLLLSGGCLFLSAACPLCRPRSGFSRDLLEGWVFLWVRGGPAVNSTDYFPWSGECVAGEMHRFGKVCAWRMPRHCGNTMGVGSVRNK